MPTGQIFVAAAVVALLYYGIGKVGHGAKHAWHSASCHLHHTCAKNSKKGSAK